MSRKRASRRRGPNRAPINDINMTPLIDVMLVLLIIFMVAMPVLETGEKVDVAAEGASNNKAPTRLVSAEMRMDGSVRITAGPDERTTDLATLRQAIDTLGTPEAGKIYIRAEDKVSYDRYFGLVSAVRGAGLTPVIVAKGASANPTRASSPPL